MGRKLSTKSMARATCVLRCVAIRGNHDFSTSYAVKPADAGAEALETRRRRGAGERTARKIRVSPVTVCGIGSAILLARRKEREKSMDRRASNFETTHSTDPSRVEIKTELTEAELSNVSGGVQHKHLAGVKYEDITINCQR